MNIATAKTSVLELSQRIQSNLNRLDQIKASADSIISDFILAAQQYDQLAKDLETETANSGGNLSWQVCDSDMKLMAKDLGDLKDRASRFYEAVKDL